MKGEGMKTRGEKLLEYRILNNLTQQDMVKLIGCCLSTYRSLENDAQKKTDYDKRIEEVLDGR